MTKRFTKWPICKRLGVLRVTKGGYVIVSTEALYAVLNRRLYREVIDVFAYRGYGGCGPLPGPIEDFLATETDADEKT